MTVYIDGKASGKNLGGRPVTLTSAERKIAKVCTFTNAQLDKIQSEANKQSMTGNAWLRFMVESA